MTTITPEKIAQDLLEIAILEDGPKCDGVNKRNCRNEIAYSVTCKCGTGIVYLCSPCLQRAEEYSKQKLLFGLLRTRVMFTKKCGHIVLLDECTIRPI